MESVKLTKNSLSALAEDLEAKLKPIVLVVYVNNIGNKKYKSNGSDDEQYHYSMVISDGTRKKMPVFVANSLNHMLKSGIVGDGSIVKLSDYKPFRSNHFKSITVTDMTISEQDCDSKSTHSMKLTEQGILNEGAIAKIAEGNKYEKPIVQALYLFKSTDERNMMLISDGQHMQMAMLDSHLDRYVTSKKLKKGTVVQLTEYICPTIQNRMEMVVIHMDIIHSDYDVIGEAKLYVETTKANSTMTGVNVQFFRNQPPNMMPPFPAVAPMIFPPMFPAFINPHFQFACYQQQYGLYQRQFRGYEYQCDQYCRLESRMRKEREKNRRLVQYFEQEINDLKKDLEAAKKMPTERSNNEAVVDPEKHVEPEKTSEDAHFKEIEEELGEFGFMVL